MSLSPTGTIQPSSDSSGKKTIDLSSSAMTDIMTQPVETQNGALGIFGQSIKDNPDAKIGSNVINTTFDILHGIGALPLNIQVDNLTGNAAQLLTQLGTINGPEDVTSTITKLAENPETSARTVVDSVTATITSAIATRVNTISLGAGAQTAPSSRASGGATGVSDTGGSEEIQATAFEEAEPAGENLEASAGGVAAGSTPYDKFGVWGSVNFGQANKKVLKGNPAFKSISQGITIGVDTLINERTTIGFNVANSYTKVKYKGNSQGNKTDTSSWIGAVYGNYQLNDKWFVRGTALLNTTHINSKSLYPITVNSYGVAKAKYNMLSYGGDAVIGFAQRFANGILLTPTLGVRLLHNNKIAYTEKGNTAFNTSSKQKALTSYSTLAGLSVARKFIKREIEFTSEAHINAQYGINSKGPKGSFVNPLTPNETTTFVGTSPSKLTTIYGIGVTAATDRIETAVGADMTVANKYVSYQGSLKLKVKF